MTRTLKWIVSSIAVAFTVVFIILCIAINGKNISIREQTNTIARQQEMIDSLRKYNKELGEMNGITVSVEFSVKNTNVLSINNNNIQTIAKELATYTRKEVLDSLKNKK